MITWTTNENNIEWCSDENNNKCSVEYFGTKDAAEKALNSLIKCENCINCHDCSSCHDCSYCRSKEKETGDFVPPVIPKIENIHQKILDAVSQPNALNMGCAK